MSQMDPRLRKRILMLYFAAGINIVMAMWVVSVGRGHVAGGTLGLITLVFLAFAAVNFHLARSLQRKWLKEVRRQNETQLGE